MQCLGAAVVGEHLPLPAEWDQEMEKLPECRRLRGEHPARSQGGVTQEGRWMNKHPAPVSSLFLLPPCPRWPILTGNRQTRDPICVVTWRNSLGTLLGGKGGGSNIQHNMRKANQQGKETRIFLHWQKLVQNGVEKSVSIKGGQDRKWLVSWVEHGPDRPGGRSLVWEVRLLRVRPSQG